MKIDCIVKVGGSLQNFQSYNQLSQVLNQVKRICRIVVLPGGSNFADLVRKVDRKNRLPQPVPHWMSILAMEQYGFFLTTKLKNSVPARTKKEIHEALRNNRLSIFLPFNFLYKKDPVPHSWEFTSDSISAYLADQFCVPKLILLKVIDGVMVKPEKGKKPILEKMISKENLRHVDCVDRYLGRTLKKGVECWVINGRKPERILELLKHGETIGTRIVS